MAWFEGTATDYRNMLAKLLEFATNDNVDSVAIDTAGTGYSVDDVLVVSGGTSSTAARLEVTAVGGSGEITGVRVLTGGAYTVQPTNPVSVTGGGGSGAQFDLTFQSAAWTALRDANQIYARRVSSIQAAGTGYNVDNILTLDSSGGATTAVVEATFRVTSVGGSGEITGLAVETLGEYTTSAVETLPLTGGDGSGATAIVTFDGVAGEDEVILQSGATEQPILGYRTFQPGGGAFNWWLAAMTAFDDELTFGDQPGISPGNPNAALSTDRLGSYCPMSSASMGYFMSITDRHIHLVVQVGTTFHQSMGGLLDRLTTSGQYPLPIYVLGSSSDSAGVAGSPTANNAAFPDPQTTTSAGAGPGAVRLANGVWRPIRNRIGDDANDDSVSVWPNVTVYSSLLSGADDWVPDSGGTTGPFPVGWMGPSTNISSDPNVFIEPAPGSGGAVSVMFPLTAIDYTNTQILGQFPGLFWVSSRRDGASPATSGDAFQDGSGVRHRFFQNVNRSRACDFFAMAET